MKYINDSNESHIVLKSGWPDASSFQNLPPKTTTQKLLNVMTSTTNIATRLMSVGKGRTNAISSTLSEGTLENILMTRIMRIHLRILSRAASLPHSGPTLNWVSGQG